MFSSSGASGTDQLVSTVSNPLNSNDIEMQEGSSQQRQPSSSTTAESAQPLQSDIIEDIDLSIVHPTIQISSGSAMEDEVKNISNDDVLQSNSKHIAFETDNEDTENDHENEHNGEVEYEDEDEDDNGDEIDDSHLTIEDGGDLIDVSDDDAQYSHDENVSIYSTMNQIESIPGTETDLKSDAGPRDNANPDDPNQRNIHKSSIIDIDSESDIENLEEFEQSANNAPEDRSRELEVKGLYEDNNEESTVEPEHEEFYSEEITNNTNDNDEDDDEDEDEDELEEETTNGADLDENEGGISFEEANIPIILKVTDAEFILYPIDQEKCAVDCSLYVSLYDNSEIIHATIEEFFGSIRANEDLKEIIEFEVDEELVLEVPELSNLKVTEDNIYSRDISIEDFFRVFLELKESTRSTDVIPKSISFNITTQTRFISRFNELSELIRDGKGFESIPNTNKRRLDKIQREESIKKPKLEE
ncbi:hypothetical protein DFJ63DRAFT_317353 [Scheffersomyces coipomensis]|uniref:uncharacterized protein n=1 Tax=Scheffersomyces coipomensis TaxID=1788519 RepID=UPI00315D1B0D